MTGEELLDAEDLDLGEDLSVGRVSVCARVVGGVDHPCGGRTHADEDAHAGVLGLDGAYEVSDVAGVGGAAFDGDQDPF